MRLPARPLLFTFALAILLFSLFAVNETHSKKSLYQILGVSKSATLHDIKRAYRKLAAQHHPDKGGSEDKFKEINGAYEVLSKEDRRMHYDRTGETEERQGGGGHGGFNFGFPFGFGGGFRNRNSDSEERKRRPDTVIPLFVTLEEIYDGAYFEVEIQKQAQCHECGGTGAHGAEGLHTCHKCKGQGIVIGHQQIGPGMYAQVQKQCDACAGKGKIIKKKCPVCNAKKVLKRTERVPVQIPSGAPHGHRIVLEGAGDASEDMDPANVIFVVQAEQASQEHPVFRREGNNLHVTVTLTLNEALFGFKKTLTHLDGRKVLLERTTVTQPSQVIGIEDEGMPIIDSDLYGLLYVKYDVVLPRNIEATKLSELRKLLSKN